MNKLSLLLLFLICMNSCAATEIQGVLDETENVSSANIRKQMVDSLATAETIQLYILLHQHTQTGSGMLYGHESSNMQGWSFNKFNPNQLQSDVMASISDLPAIFGYDFNRGYKSLLPIARQAAEAGGIITISNHMKFPTTNSYHYSTIKKSSQILLRPSFPVANTTNIFWMSSTILQTLPNN